MTIRMIDVGDKTVTERTARAEGWIRLDPEVYRRVIQKDLPKGDALLLAQVAGIQGAKRTADLLPLCHPLPLEGVKVESHPQPDGRTIRIETRARTTGKTGVEMEALAAVSAALLCIYDLTKMFDATAEIGGIRLLEKTGGKSGHWRADGSGSGLDRADLSGQRAIAITVSDRAAAGAAEDRSGPLLAAWLVDRGATLVARHCLPDDPDPLAETVQAAIAEGATLILLSGGTGLGPRDRTPEALQSLGGREVPGIGEALRQAGVSETPMSWISRSGAWVIGGALVVALPGSPRAVASGLTTLEPLLAHSLAIVAGGHHG